MSWNAVFFTSSLITKATCFEKVGRDMEKMPLELSVWEDPSYYSLPNSSVTFTVTI